MLSIAFLNQQTRLFIADYARNNFKIDTFNKSKIDLLNEIENNYKQLNK